LATRIAARIESDRGGFDHASPSAVAPHLAQTNEAVPTGWGLARNAAGPAFLQSEKAAGRLSLDIAFAQDGALPAYAKLGQRELGDTRATHQGSRLADPAGDNPCQSLVSPKPARTEERMVNLMEAMPVLALAFMIVCIPILGEKP
jgi:hypothetical protein